MFSFRFVNYFAALYYYAFLTDSLHDPSNSILRVASALLVYLTVAHWWNVLLTIYIPLLYHRWNLYSIRLRVRSDEERGEDFRTYHSRCRSPCGFLTS